MITSSMRFQTVRFGQGTNQPPRPWHKLDPKGRHLMLRGQLQGDVEVLVRLDRDRQQSQGDTMDKLKKAGFNAQFFTGHVMGGLSMSTGVIDSGKLQALHDLEWVNRIEVLRLGLDETP